MASQAPRHACRASGTCSRQGIAVRTHRTHTAHCRSTAAERWLAPVALRPGTAYLCGTGPGGIEHVTIQAARIIASAQCIVYDDLGTQELLAAAPAGCELHYVGKRGGQASISQPEINSLLVQLCKQGKAVVRLKGGCCSTFSRVSAEAAALAAAGCDFEAMPGVSSATSASVLAGFPLTDTQLAGSYAVVSGHDPAATSWGAFQHIPTLVVLMAGRHLHTISQQLQHTGWSPDTPVAVVKEAGLASQQSWFSTLGAIASDLQGIKLSPCVLVVGRVAGLPAAWAGLMQQARQDTQPA